MDPHKRSATVEVTAGDETILGRGRFGTGRAREFTTGQGPQDWCHRGHSVALVDTRMAGLCPVQRRAGRLAGDGEIGYGDLAGCRVLYAHGKGERPNRGATVCARREVVAARGECQDREDCSFAASATSAPSIVPSRRLRHHPHESCYLVPRRERTPPRAAAHPGRARRCECRDRGLSSGSRFRGHDHRAWACGQKKRCHRQQSAGRCAAEEGVSTGLLARASTPLSAHM